MGLIRILSDLPRLGYRKVFLALPGFGRGIAPDTKRKEEVA
jgi:hypothetical protein